MKQRRIVFLSIAGSVVALALGCRSTPTSSEIHYTTHCVCGTPEGDLLGCTAADCPNRVAAGDVTAGTQANPEK
ncbi:MAG: hypothetical protein HYR85_17345 [Planctomycetes bacterium]|nr:hypothetical protein [Planctomycetota bacterium]MBI3843427.1 hypothetical protein [Planctomycetota bacterium]